MSRVARRGEGDFPRRKAPKWITKRMGGETMGKPLKPKLLVKATRPIKDWYALPTSAQAGIPEGTGTRAKKPPLIPSVGFTNRTASAQAAQRRVEEPTRIITTWEARDARVGPRDFGRYPLQIELVPNEAQGINLRFFLTEECWRSISQLKAAQNRHAPGEPAICEICRQPARNPDCHEQWSYDVATCTQRLEGLWCLCKDCHLAKHLGRAFAVQKENEEAQKRAEEAEGRARPEGKPLFFDRAMAKLQDVNQIERLHADAYFLWALNLQRERQHIVWRLDFDWLLDWLAQPGQRDIALRWRRGEPQQARVGQLIGRAAISAREPDGF